LKVTHRRRHAVAQAVDGDDGTGLEKTGVRSRRGVTHVMIEQAHAVRPAAVDAARARGWACRRVDRSLIAVLFDLFNSEQRAFAWIH
jgi:hypothetical protein